MPRQVGSEVKRCLEEWCDVWRLEVPLEVPSRVLRDALWMRLRGESVLLVIDNAQNVVLIDPNRGNKVYRYSSLQVQLQISDRSIRSVHDF